MLVYAPVPEPSKVLESAIVGFSDLLQQTPLEVTSEPPSSVTFPIAVATVGVADVTSDMVTVGVDFFVQEPMAITDKNTKNISMRFMT